MLLKFVVVYGRDRPARTSADWNPCVEKLLRSSCIRAAPADAALGADAPLQPSSSVVKISRNTLTICSAASLLEQVDVVHE